ncbi:hypothetical protein B9057_02625 [Aestuarium zhoushanense]|nr:hypothetical protein B9057_02625 [Aestuarium zhoushanense]
MEMKSKLLTATALIALAATSASANTIYFNQEDQTGGTTVGIGAMTITQDNTGNSVGTSTTDSSVVGALATLTIKQLGATATGNTADFAVHGSDSSTTGTLIGSFTGSSNNWDLVIGASTDTTRYVNPDYSLTVAGSTNTINDNMANGAASTDAFDYTGTITGDGNTVRSSSSSGVGAVNIAYAVTGDSNTVTTALSSASGARDIDLSLTGDSNTLNLNAQSATSSAIDLTLAGNAVAATIGQTGTSSSMLANVSHSGTSAFTLTTSATGSGQSADITLVAANGGSFTLNQDADNAVYNAAHNIAAGGSVTVNQ